jgi:hypothetical protein
VRKRWNMPSLSLGVGLLAVTLVGAVGEPAYSAHAGSSAAASDQASARLATSDAALARRPAPPALAPPAGQSLVAVFDASGTQIYQCTAGAWIFVEPAASLSGWSKQPPSRQSAIHFRGPSWESTKDGSLVEAKAVASSPVAGSIPELLLQATRTRGDGLFGHVTYAQRLATSGGAAPAGACTDGASAGVPYRAEYRFFAPAS